MKESTLSRGLNGWRFVVLRRVRHRRLVKRSTMHMLHGLLSTAFETWMIWTDRDSVRKRVERLEDQVEVSKLELAEARGDISRELEARAEASMRIATLEHELSAAEVASTNAVEALQQLRCEMQDVSSELQMQNDKLASANAELADALAFGRGEQAKVQRLETDLADGKWICYTARFVVYFVTYMTTCQRWLYVA